jgi:phage tail sheath protein FI
MAYKTPGVYVEEVSLFPPSVAEVETAIPAFIGYTEIAVKNGADITLQPLKISSLNDYETYFGKAPAATDLAEISVSETSVADPADAAKKKHVSYAAEIKKIPAKLPKSILYYALQIFFDNGGGDCYIVSIGKADGTTIKADDFTKGLDVIRNFDEPTLLVAPEAVYLDKYETFYQAMIKQASELKDRFVIVDTQEPKSPQDIVADSTAFRAFTFGDKEEVRYSAAYYPWLNSAFNYLYKADDIKITSGKIIDHADPTKEVDLKDKKISEIQKDYDELYQLLGAELSKKLTVTMPPSAAVAGAYAYVDNTRGVWKAPANVVLKSVISPSVQISLEQQRDLNVDPTGGRSMNAIRFIPGSGITIWGARTMNGNDREWRYVNVRRFFNMVEESVQKATSWAVFEPNTKNTWVKVKGMIESYLLTKWIEGALAGSKPEEAFFVKVGLPETMSADEVLDGIMRVKIGLAVSRPAEFIIIQFTHIKQTS